MNICCTVHGVRRYVWFSHRTYTFAHTHSHYSKVDVTLFGNMGGMGNAGTANIPIAKHPHVCMWQWRMPVYALYMRFVSDVQKLLSQSEIYCSIAAVAFSSLSTIFSMPFHFEWELCDTFEFTCIEVLLWWIATRTIDPELQYRQGNSVMMCYSSNRWVHNR